MILSSKNRSKLWFKFWTLWISDKRQQAGFLCLRSDSSALSIIVDSL